MVASPSKAIYCEEMLNEDQSKVSKTDKDQVLYLSKVDFWEEIKDNYVQKIADMDSTEVYRSNNPGPTNPDGSMNFECHCVGHMVASPCGFEFREAITCQKTATDEEMQTGKCGDEMMSFMECVMRTQCFKSNNNEEEETKAKSL